MLALYESPRAATLRDTPNSTPLLGVVLGMLYDAENTACTIRYLWSGDYNDATNYERMVLARPDQISMTTIRAR